MIRPSLSLKVISPVVDISSCKINLNRVDLPVPLSPESKIFSPALMWMSGQVRLSTLLKFLRKPVIYLNRQMQLSCSLKFAWKQQLGVLRHLGVQQNILQNINFHQAFEIIAIAKILTISKKSDQLAFSFKKYYRKIRYTKMSCSRIPMQYLNQRKTLPKCRQSGAAKLKKHVRHRSQKF